MSYFLKFGNTIKIADKAAVDITETLPCQNYIVSQTPQGEFILQGVDDFDVPTDLYGDVTRNVERVINTFNDRHSSTGVLLTGEKGSGKSMTAKLISVEAAKQGLPTILVNEALYGDAFNKFLQDIGEAVILFDEFEKVYDREEQPHMLTVLDGVFTNKKLFLLTCNDKWVVNDNMRNRPGRIYYLMDFTGLDQTFIREYCQKNLKDKSQIDAVGKAAMMFYSFNFDMLQAIVEEMNRYGETAVEAIKLLNTKPESANKSMHDVESLTVNGTKIPKDGVDTEYLNINPLVDIAYVDYILPSKDKTKEENWKRVTFRNESIVDIDAEKGTITYKQGRNSLVLKKRVFITREWTDYL